ncbi:hypothetical protein SJPD1_1906 [Sulfurospirillum diekertiae]|uniref:ATPase AAA-type core domain-containing protein n=1 Tax=Sulfurospirillum diekertiae TaxID=1854492 RepID=A0A290HFJ8_9BACT|nr:ATP-binding protein [Sulfurospirillum diekertiae]ATB70011.1 hypothetical protein SJPD1_1906 [Sulfurospirillum diekertiae]
MLKRFTLENFSSFRDESSLDLTAGRTEILPKHVVNFDNVKILKSAIVYGANASGKSNLIKSISYAKDIVLDGLNSVDTYKKYFRLDIESSKKPTSFEFELELDNKFYAYGFSVILEKKEIVEEWLYEIGKNTSDKIFTRKSKTISFGKFLKGEKDLEKRFSIYADDMKNQGSQLFLSEIATKNLENDAVKIFNNIYKWFDKKLQIMYPSSKFNRVSSIGSDKNLSQIFKKYLNEFDTGIVDISSIEEDFEKSLKDVPEEIKDQIKKDLLKENTKGEGLLQLPNGTFLRVYKDANGELKTEKLGLVHSHEVKDVFELTDESDGTRRLFDLIPLIQRFAKDYTIIIDEFDRSLHPKLTKKFFELFYALNNSKTQLIVSTHESTLLDLELARKDEIWFVEKDKSGSSKVFSLNLFKDRYDKKVEKAYLLGRYGAIPIFKSFDEIDTDK